MTCYTMSLTLVVGGTCIYTAFSRSCCSISVGLRSGPWLGQPEYFSLQRTSKLTQKLQSSMWLQNKPKSSTLHHRAWQLVWGICAILQCLVLSDIALYILVKYLQLEKKISPRNISKQANYNVTYFNIWYVNWAPWSLRHSSWVLCSFYEHCMLWSLGGLFSTFFTVYLSPRFMGSI